LVAGIGEDAFYGCENLNEVHFAVTEGWYHSYEDDEDDDVVYTLSIPKEDIADTATVARYLKDTYCWHLWTRKG
jgi:hypothetical protein